MMAQKYGMKLDDCEEIRYEDRIKALAWKEALDAGATFITKKWVAGRLNRSTRWVQMQWGKTYAECKRTKKPVLGRPIVLSQESKDIMLAATCKKGTTLRRVDAEILEKRDKTVSHMKIKRFYVWEGITKFREIAKPLKTEKNREDRLYYADFLSEFEEHDFLRIAPSDEFFIYSQRKPNHQNDWIWARSLDEIPDEVRYRELSKYPDCIGLFVLFTARKMFWVIKERGQSWDGAYFREQIIPEVTEFLTNEDNVIDVDEVILLHDKAPGWTANATQELLTQGPVDFFNKSEYPGNSPDLNPCEDIGAIIKERVESQLLQEAQRNRETLTTVLIDVLQNLQFETDMFAKLLLSYPGRLDALRANNGGHTGF